MFQLHYHAQKPLTTAHLAQTMTLLSLTVGELRQQIEAELSSNPALELVEERRCPHCHRLLPATGSCPVCSSPQSENPDEAIIFLSPRDEFYSSGEFSGDEGSSDDEYSASSENLPTFVLRQIGPELNEQDRKLAAYMLTNLDEDGLLTISLVEIAQYYHIPLSHIQRVQKLIQHAEPLGVGSCTTQEALLVQIDSLSENGFVPKLAKPIIEDSMDLLSHRQYNELARKYKVSIAQVQKAVQFISDNLNPFPARMHWGDTRQPEAANVSAYHHPDILINCFDENPQKPLIVEIILPLCGSLRVNPLFRRVVQEANDEKRDEWRGDMERASLFVKCIQQRNHTIQRLVHRVVNLQRDFIIHGEKYLKPVTRAQLSKELGVHESTISRAVANKTVQLPNKRIIPLAEFFDRSLNIRSILKDIIAFENRPLSDSELAVLLAEKGHAVARRTVAKYRSMEGILPAHLRQSVSRGV